MTTLQTDSIVATLEQKVRTGRRCSDFFRSAVAMTTLATAATAWGQNTNPAPGPAKTPNGMTWGELSLLPEYCADAMGILYGDQYFNPSPRAAKWVAIMGQGFWAIHHYCRAQQYVRQAEAAAGSPQQRRYLYGKAKQDYIYALNNSGPDMILAPEILVRLGEAHIKLGEPGEAYSAFERARQKKPDYWPAYSRWVDVLMGLKMRKEARELAGQGLAYSPDSETLIRQYKALGGDPASVVRAALPPPPAASGATAAPATSAAQAESAGSGQK